MTILTSYDHTIDQFRNGIHCTGLTHSLLGSVNLLKLKNLLGFGIESPDIPDLEARIAQGEAIDTRKLNLILHPPDSWIILAVRMQNDEEPPRVLNYLLLDNRKRARINMFFEKALQRDLRVALSNRFRIIPSFRNDVLKSFSAYIGAAEIFPTLSLIDQNCICDETDAHGKTPKSHSVVKTFPEGENAMEDAKKWLTETLGRQNAHCPFEYWDEDPVLVS